MAISWRKAYLTQAISDYRMYQWLSGAENRSRVELCHRLHYLQMATEKLAKGLKIDLKGKALPKFIHNAFLEFIQKHARRNRELQRACHQEKSNQAFAGLLEEFAPLVEWIENLAPKGSDYGKYSINPEYPWISKQAVSGKPFHPQEIMQVPSNYHYPELFVFGNQLGKLEHFLGICFKIAQCEIGN
ncbi:MAG: hypothetical protein NTX50_10315 [Candidatus Sumerlaeota bacterium]|nr:hypothetical protein [Candidatus Sumerlaeota bacterium]